MDGITQYELIGAGEAVQLSNVVGKDDFLKLLVTQMRYQDPLNPLKGTEFSAQLAQFSSLEQLQNIANKLDASVEADMLLAMSINNTMATTLVGKNVRAISNELFYDGENPITIDYKLSGNASKVTVEIVDDNGQVLRTLTATGMMMGDRSIDWDGRDNRGNNVPTGQYQVRVSATAQGGGMVAAQPLAIGTVSGVRFVNGNPMLLVDGLEIPFGAVLEITNGDGNSQSGTDNWYRRLIDQGL